MSLSWKEDGNGDNAMTQQKKHPSLSTSLYIYVAGITVYNGNGISLFVVGNDFFGWW